VSRQKRQVALLHYAPVLGRQQLAKVRLWDLRKQIHLGMSLSIHSSAEVKPHTIQLLLVSCSVGGRTLLSSWIDPHPLANYNGPNRRHNARGFCASRTRCLVGLVAAVQQCQTAFRKAATRVAGQDTKEVHSS
jgi:hypothetical protein